MKRLKDEIKTKERFRSRHNKKKKKVKKKSIPEGEDTMSYKKTKSGLTAAKPDDKKNQERTVEIAKHEKSR